MPRTHRGDCPVAMVPFKLMPEAEALACRCDDLLTGTLRETQRIRDLISDIAGPNAETMTNERGGSQSNPSARFDLIDSKAMFAMAKVLDEGAKKYGENNWRLIAVEDHLNHLIMHAYAYLDGDTSDEHLSHALCRAMFALAVDLDPERGA